MSQQTVNSSAFTIDFLFSNSTLELDSTSLVEMFNNKADVRIENCIDSVGSIWFTTQSGINPTYSTDEGGIGSSGLWEKIGSIVLSDTKTLYIYERQS